MDANSPFKLSAGILYSHTFVAPLTIKPFFVNYEDVESLSLNYPPSDFNRFKRNVLRLPGEFSSENQITDLLDRGSITREHFHQLLLTLFHQVYYSSTSFALAGAMCDGRFFKVREYLLHHAEEEQDHWKWIIQNLRDTGYVGKDPREVFPSFPTQSYISYAVYLATKHPVARLAMGYVLESLSGQFGVSYGKKAAEQLGFSREQMSFFLLHGELDAGHSKDILDVLEFSPLSPYEWAYCEYAAECTLALYRNLYNHAASLIHPIKMLG